MVHIEEILALRVQLSRMLAEEEWGGGWWEEGGGVSSQTCIISAQLKVSAVDAESATLRGQKINFKIKR